MGILGKPKKINNNSYCHYLLLERGCVCGYCQEKRNIKIILLITMGVSPDFFVVIFMDESIGEARQRFVRIGGSCEHILFITKTGNLIRTGQATSS